MNKITIIAAMDKNNGIGYKGKLPWKSLEDLEFFKTVTTGHTVIMGRNTWDSLPSAVQPLPNRENIVVTSQPLKGAKRADSLSQAIALADPNAQIFIIGGAQLYKEALNIADHMLLTLVEGDYQTDVQFPPFDSTKWVQQWQTKSFVASPAIVISSYRRAK